MSIRRALWAASALALLLPCVAMSDDGGEPPPVYAAIEMEGGPWNGENCEGGEWNFSWSGPVAVEPGPLSDLLQSYTAFDTSQPNQGAMPPARFAARSVTCRDNHGEIGMRATVQPSANEKIQLSVSLAEGGVPGSPGIAFSAQDLGMCRVESSGHAMDFPVMVSVNTAATIQLSPALEITLEDLKNGFNKSYSFDGTVIGAAPMCMGHELTSGKLTLRYRSGEQDPAVSLNACLHLAKDEIRDVTAKGTPEGGKFQYGSSGGVFDVQDRGDGAATVRGDRPGKGAVRVDYVRSGIASAAVAGSVVELVSINNGVALPKFGLFGTNGLLISGARSFPLKLNPSDGFVQMTLANDVLASVNNTSTSVLVQPIKLGTTTLQAKTLCGTPIGAGIPIVIVRCDDEVIKELQTQQRETKAEIDQLVRRITGMLAQDDFQKAATEIGASTKDLALKTGESIVGTLTFKDGKSMELASKQGIQLSKELTIGANRIKAVNAVYEIGNAANDAGEWVGDPGDWQKGAKVAVNTLVAMSMNGAIALGKTYGEAYLAAEKFGRQLGTLAGVTEQLEQLEPQLDRLVQEYIRISTRLEYCQKVPPRDDLPVPPPKPVDPTPVPVEVQEPVEIPVPEEPKPDKDDPPPPKQEPGQKVYGMACRIQDLRAPGVGQRLLGLRQWVLAERTAPPNKPGDSALGSFTSSSIDTALQRAEELQTLNGFTQDLRTLKAVADDHARSLATARGELQQWRGAIDRMKSALDGTDEQGTAAFPAFRRSLDTFLLQSVQTGDKSLETMMETDECRDRLEVKVDQVRARYN